MHKAGACFVVFAVLLALALLLPHPAFAAWPTDPLVNVPLCTAASSQNTPTIVADGAGGAIVAWTDPRSGNSDIYAQRISAAGTVQWTADGVALCSAAGNQPELAVVSDDAGGAIVTWTDLRSGTEDIYAQRISAAGAVQWTADGVALCTATGTQLRPSIASDGAGGAIVTWIDFRTGSSYDVYAQRISAAGAVQWMADGVALCTVTSNKPRVTITVDGAGGAIVAWHDNRNANYDIYAQRIKANGAVEWTAGGVAVCTSTGDQQFASITSDGVGGAIASWQDGRNGGANYDIFARRISAAGAVLWTADGVALCTATGNQQPPVMAPDGMSGAIVTWYDPRNGNNDIYAQRVSGAGAVQWTANGAALCTATGSQAGPTITADGVNGAIVTWIDSRTGTADIYAQRISGGGVVYWTADGVALCTATGPQGGPTVTSDGAGAAIVTWHDNRDATRDIYAQAVQANGQLGSLVSVPADVALALALEPVRPNPSRGGSLTVRFTLASAAAASLELLDVAGRRMATREVGSLGAGRHALDLGDGRCLAPGLYLVCLRQGANARVTRVAVLK